MRGVEGFEMRFLVPGATGVTGTSFVEQALAAGNHVTTYIRNPGKLSPREGLTATRGDVRNSSELTEVMRGHDAVVSMLGLDSPSRIRRRPQLVEARRHLEHGLLSPFTLCGDRQISSARRQTRTELPPK